MGANKMSGYKADYVFYVNVLDQIRKAAEQRMENHYSPHLFTDREREVVAKFEALRDQAYERLIKSGEKL